MVSTFEMLKAKLSALGDAIRRKSQIDEKYTLDEMADVIDALPQIDTSPATLDSGDKMLAGYTAYAKGQVVTGTIETMEGQTLTSSNTAQTVACAGKYMSGDVVINGMSNGSASMSAATSGDYYAIKCTCGVAGYMAKGRVLGTKNLLSISGGVTITPTTTQQTAVPGARWVRGAIYVAGDANLVSSNIISGVSIFGVEGSVVLNKCYSGTTEPDASLGSDGDIYFMVEA